MAFKENNGVGAKRDAEKKRAFGTNLTNNSTQVAASKKGLSTAPAKSLPAKAPSAAKRIRTTTRAQVTGIPIDENALPEDYQPILAMPAYKMPADLDVPLELLLKPSHSFDLTLEPVNKSTTLHFSAEGKLLMPSDLDAFSPLEEISPEEF